MASFICLLRGVNVGGKGKVPMAELATVFEGLGFEKVKTLLQSGNVVFTTSETKRPALTKRIETAIEHAFRYQADAHLLTPAELGKIIDGNPYPMEAKSDPGHMVTLFVPGSPEKSAREKLGALVTLKEKFTITPRAVYIYYAGGAGVSKMAGGALDRALGVRGTGRNWNTVNKLIELAESL